MNTNKKNGNAFEREFCQYLFEKGFWVLNVPQYSAGQPADVVAVKDGRAYLIDCKVCSRRGFVLSRVEENQKNAMQLWYECGNGVGWFAIKTMNGEIWMMQLHILEMLKRQKSTLNHNDLIQYGEPIERWVKR
ncbi:MAG: hypothetical protein PUF49_11325 [Firmicutes bacterium]|nr:hypothetical protein [Bacillota bacterium]